MRFLSKGQIFSVFLASLCLLTLFMGSIRLQGAEKDPPQPTKVSFRLDWTPWSLHTFLFVAKEKGYFSDENLDVDLYVPSNPEDTIKLVAAGQDHFGLSYQIDTILGRSEGLPVVSIAAIVQHSLNVILSLKESGITKPSDLKGKKIGSPLIPSDDAYLEKILGGIGLRKGRDYTVVDVGFNLVQPLLTKQIDAVIGTYSVWEKIQIELEGFEVNVIRLQDYGVPDFYESVLLTNEKLIQENPDLIRRFMRAAWKGLDFTMAHPDEALGILLKQNPDLRKDLAQRSLVELIPLMKNSVPKVGWQTEAKWQELQDFMMDMGLIKQKTKVSSMFTNEFLP
jgi:putative hydroxymethylpyrimidine transport system substrate-binding protein